MRPCSRGGRSGTHPTAHPARVCVSPKNRRVSGQPRGVDGDATNDLIVGTRSRQRLAGGVHLRRPIDDDAKYLTTTFKVLCSQQRSLIQFPILAA